MHAVREGDPRPALRGAAVWRGVSATPQCRRKEQLGPVLRGRLSGRPWVVAVCGSLLFLEGVCVCV